MKCARSELGFISMWFAPLLAMIILGAGAGFDMWQAYSLHRHLSEVANSSAAYSASQIQEGVYRNSEQVVLDPAQATVGAEDVAVQNGVFRHEVTVAMENRCSPAGPNGVTVTIRRPAKFLILGYFTTPSQQVVTASSTAYAIASDAGVNPC